MAITEKQKQIISSVIKHAARNYERGAWDIVTECYSKNDIFKIVGRCTTVNGAIKKMAKHLQPQSDQRDEYAHVDWERW